MTKCRKQQQKVYACLLGCGRDFADGYDPALLLAGSLRSIVPEDAILCRGEEQVFLVLSVSPLRTLTEQSQQAMAELLGAQIEPPQLLSLFREIRSGSLSEQIMELQDLIHDMNEQIESSTAYLMDYRDALHRLRLRIMGQPQRDWSVEEITKEIGISRSHLQRLYRELFGTSLTEDLIGARIRRAEYLLTHTNLRINEIADECGYKNETHFMRQFKKRTDMTPTQYRERVL